MLASYLQRRSKSAAIKWFALTSAECFILGKSAIDVLNTGIVGSAKYI
jgi:hypothetical protein